MAAIIITPYARREKHIHHTHCCLCGEPTHTSVQETLFIAWTAMLPKALLDQKNVLWLNLEHWQSFLIF